MPRTREKILEDRRLLKAEYGELFDSVTALLFRHDPLGINFKVNPDEYDRNTQILPRLGNCESSADVLRVMHEEFNRWFERTPQVLPSGMRRSLMRFGSCGTADLRTDNFRGQADYLRNRLGNVSNRVGEVEIF